MGLLFCMANFGNLRGRISLEYNGGLDSTLSHISITFVKQLFDSAYWEIWNFEVSFSSVCGQNAVTSWTVSDQVDVEIRISFEYKTCRLFCVDVSRAVTYCHIYYSFKDTKMLSSTAAGNQTIHLYFRRSWAWGVGSLYSLFVFHV